MSRILVLAGLLSAAALAGCATRDEPASLNIAAISQECSAATTGDMYRYCLEVGPQQAIVEPAIESRDTAVALTSD